MGAAFALVLAERRSADHLKAMPLVKHEGWVSREIIPTDVTQTGVGANPNDPLMAAGLNTNSPIAGSANVINLM